MPDGVTEGPEAAASAADLVKVPGQRTEPDPLQARLRPRTAYRKARGWSREQAADAYEKQIGSLAAAAGGEQLAMTAELLRQHEDWPDGGVQPSARTLAILAQLYHTDPQDLIDQRDRDSLPPADLVLLTQQQPDRGGRTSLAESVIGQATAALAFAAAVIYAAGGLSLGLKLWFMKVPWTPVLGQIPRDLIVVTAVGQVVLPCLITGAALGSLIDWLSVAPLASRWSTLRRNYWQAPAVPFLLWTAGIAVAAGAAFGMVPVLILWLTKHALRPGVLQSRYWIFTCCAVLSAVAVIVALGALRHLYGLRTKSGPVTNTAWRRASAAALASLALVPLFCSVSGSFLLPPVYLCGPNFMHPGKDPAHRVAGYMQGNLIGTNSQWVYIAQFQYNAKGAVYATTITAVPESAVDLQAIGRSAGCGDLLKK